MNKEQIIHDLAVAMAVKSIDVETADCEFIVLRSYWEHREALEDLDDSLFKKSF